MSRIPALSFLLAGALVGAACGSSTVSTLDADAPADNNGLAASPATPAAAAGSSTGLVSFQSSVLGQVQTQQRAVQSGSFELTADIDADGQPSTIAITGSFDNAAETSEMVLDVSQMGALADEQAGIDALNLDQYLGEPMTIRIIGDQAYATGGFFQLLAGGSGWLALGTDEAATFTTDLAAGYGNTDILSEFEDDDVTIETVGTETIDGVETTHYQVTVDREGTAPFDIWIDADNLLRRVIVTEAAPDEATGASGTATITIRYFDLNEPVSIEAPPADEIVDASSIAGLLGDN